MALIWAAIEFIVVVCCLTLVILLLIAQDTDEYTTVTKTPPISNPSDMIIWVLGLATKDRADICRLVRIVFSSHHPINTFHQPALDQVITEMEKKGLLEYVGLNFYKLGPAGLRRLWQLENE